MALATFRFEPPAGGELRQGELLADVWVHRAVVAAAELALNAAPLIAPTHHAFVVVVHSDCDLLQDFSARTKARDAGQAFDAASWNAVPQVLVCDAFPQEEIRPYVGNSGIWRRVSQNQDERYHVLTFEPRTIGPASPLVMDFRKIFMIHTEDLYSAIDGGGVGRLGVIPPIYVHDLMHRCFGYLSRVGLPE